jgi:hypothetical protein
LIDSVAPFDLEMFVQAGAKAVNCGWRIADDEAVINVHPDIDRGVPAFIHIE